MSQTWAQFCSRAELFMQRVEAALPHPLEPPNWDASIAFRYQRRASGQGVLFPVLHISSMELDNLCEIEDQKEKILRNTAQFVRGGFANNVLLTGARGTGKSSLVKACLHTFKSQGLRLIELDKDDLMDLPEIVEVISSRPEKFIIFCDDLSFDQGETGYKALKSVLDGSVAAPTANILIYATSNRRHLLPEYMSENLSYHRTDDPEVHPGEAIEEKISLSERFGLWISFYAFGQDQYLAIVRQWLLHWGYTEAQIEMARPEALLWALGRGARSGRVAYQFARDFAGRAVLT